MGRISKYYSIHNLTKINNAESSEPVPNECSEAHYDNAHSHFQLVINIIIEMLFKNVQQYE